MKQLRDIKQRNDTIMETGNEARRETNSLLTHREAMISPIKARAAAVRRLCEPETVLDSPTTTWLGS